MSFKALVKKALQTLNRQMKESEVYKEHLLSNSLRILNQKHTSLDAPNRYGTFERSLAFAFMLTQTPNRMKLFLNMASRGLTIHSSKLEKGSSWVKRGLLIALLSGTSYFCYKSLEQYVIFQSIIEENQDYVLNESVGWLGQIINQHVYKNQSITNNLTNLIHGLCTRQSVLHNTVKGLNRVYEIRDVRKNTPQLLKGVLRTNVFYEDEIFNKLKGVTISQIRSHQVRGMLVDVLVQFGQSDVCKEVVSSNCANALQNEGIRQMIRQTGFSTFHSYLDDENMRQFFVTKIRSSIAAPSTPA